MKRSFPHIRSNKSLKPIHPSREKTGSKHKPQISTSDLKDSLHDAVVPVLWSFGMERENDFGVGIVAKHLHPRGCSRVVDTGIIVLIYFGEDNGAVRESESVCLVGELLPQRQGVRMEEHFCHVVCAIP